MPKQAPAHCNKPHFWYKIKKNRTFCKKNNTYSCKIAIFFVTLYRKNGIPLFWDATNDTNHEKIYTSCIARKQSVAIVGL